MQKRKITHDDDDDDDDDDDVYWNPNKLQVVSCFGNMMCSQHSNNLWLHVIVCSTLHIAIS